jgi:hypothetical protein
MGATPTVYQQGTYAPDTSYRWMPSLAVNKFGDMAIGYSTSSSTMYPSIRYAGRLAGDALNTLGQTENTLIAGAGSQSGGYSRWGDYSSMSVDPVDDCTFWYTTEYYETTGSSWQTRIGSFRLPGCGPVVSATIHVGDLDATKRVLFTWTATVTIKVHDSSHNPVPGVTVSVLWSGGYSHSASCVTNTNGLCKLKTGAMKKSNTSVTLTITNLTNASFTYDALLNHDPEVDSTGTVITITR